MSCNTAFVIAGRVFVIAALAAAGVSCSASFPESPTPTPTLSSIQLHYNSPHVSVGVGGLVSLTLYAINSEGVFEDVSSRASWVSVNPEIASVAPRVARGERGGFTDVIVSYGGMTTTARIVVVFAGQITTMTLRPASTTVGGTSQARAMLGSTDVTDRVVWSSSDPRVLTANGGRITGVATGTAAVSATLDSLNTVTYYVSVPPLRTLPPTP